MPKVKEAKNRHHFKSSISSVDSMKEKNKAGLVNFTTTPLKMDFNFKNPFGNIRIDPTVLLKQAIQYKKSPEEEKEEVKEEKVLNEEKGFLNKKQRRQQKRKDLIKKLKIQYTEKEKLKKSKKPLEYLKNSFEDVMASLNSIESPKQNDVKPKVQTQLMFDPLKLRNIPKSLRKKQHQAKFDDILSFRKSLKKNKN